MRVAESDVKLLALHFGAITDAIDIQDASESLADALRHVGDQLTGKTMQRAELSVVRPALDTQHIALHFYVDPRGNRGLQLSLRSLQAHSACVDGDFNARRNG